MSQQEFDRHTLAAAMALVDFWLVHEALMRTLTWKQ